MKSSYSKTTYFLLAICSTLGVFSCNEKNTSNVVKISLANQTVLNYTVNTGEISMSINDTIVVTSKESYFTYQHKKYTAKSYDKSEFTKETYSDSLGNGNHYTIQYTSDSLPTLVRNFYVYTNRPYFLTSLTIIGKNIETNSINPLNNAILNLPDKANLQTVFIPYDNDAFVSYNSKSVKDISKNMSSEVGVVFNNNSRNGMVIGSLQHTVWKTGIETENTHDTLSMSVHVGYTDKSLTRDEIPHGMVKGDTVSSPKIFVGYFTDWRKGMETYAKTNRTIEPPFVFNWTKATPVGWNSWGVLQTKINYDNTTKVADFFATAIPKFREGNTAYIDLDSFWDNMVQGGFTGDFSKVKAFADYCKAKGLEPGVYWAPFTDWGYKSGADRKAEGSNYTFGEMWTKVGDGYFDFDGARALDPTHPGTLKRIDYVIAKLKACGFKMIKIDFLGHAAAEGNFYDKNITTGMEAYRVGMEHLVKQLNGQMLIYAAISPSMATARYAHMRRIACDAWKTIAQTAYTLNSVTYGWWQTYAYNFIDADHVVFDHESEAANRARLLSAVVTGTLITGDDYSTVGPWTERAKNWLQNTALLAIVNQGKAFEPVFGNTGTNASSAFITHRNGVTYLAIFNFNKKATNYKLPFELIHLAKDQSYHFKELLSGSTIDVTNQLEVPLEAEDAMIFKITKK
ncbi:alpha-galactosidase [Zhouia sp. PK063]|uniref:alpha-galactosidase n=1 Tax=Zhouia sp. PK063 TaxID=3373602 RepID=UPI0037988FE0